MRLTAPKTVAAAILVAGVAVVILWTAAGGQLAQPSTAVALPAANFGDGAAPIPLATSPAALAATLRAQDSPPSPELLRDNRVGQAAYDASARPGDFVTPPSVSVEH